METLRLDLQILTVVINPSLRFCRKQPLSVRKQQCYLPIHLGFIEYINAEIVK